MFEFWKKMFKCKILVFKLMSVLSGAYFKMLFEKVGKCVLITKAKNGRNLRNRFIGRV